MDDTKAKWGSDRDYRKEAQSDEFGRSCSDPNLGSEAFIFLGSRSKATMRGCPRTPKGVFSRALIQ